MCLAAAQLQECPVSRTNACVQKDGKDLACPLCKSLRLILNEKTLSYDVEPVDYASKPDFLSSAGMPAIKYVPDNKIVGGATITLSWLRVASCLRTRSG